jgi:hypothetical protein
VQQIAWSDEQALVLAEQGGGNAGEPNEYENQQQGAESRLIFN